MPIRDTQYIKLGVRSSKAVNVIVYANYVTPEGVVGPPLEISLLSTGDRTTADSAFTQLKNGYLTNVTCQLNKGSTAIRGQVYVGVSITPSQPGAAQTRLIQNYCRTASVLGWPFGEVADPLSGMGYLFTATGTDPAAGSEVADTVPTGAQWRLWAAEVVLVTDGTAANRLTQLFIDDAGSTVTRRLILKDTTAQTATQTRTHHWSPGTEANDAASVSYADTVTVLAKFPMSLQNGVLLPAGSNIRTVTTGIVAGDNYGAPRYVVEELLNPLT